jgi:hypothetical protein
MFVRQVVSQEQQFQVHPAGLLHAFCESGAQPLDTHTKDADQFAKEVFVYRLLDVFAFVNGFRVCRLELGCC